MEYEIIKKKYFYSESTIQSMIFGLSEALENTIDWIGQKEKNRQEIQVMITVSVLILVNNREKLFAYLT